MSHYLAKLKKESVKINHKRPAPVLSKPPKGSFDSFGSKRGRHISGKKETSYKTGLLPAWCSKSCQCLEALHLPDGEVFGCVQNFPDGSQVWKRLSVLTKCPAS